jgi:hypothetical protein
MSAQDSEVVSRLTEAVNKEFGGDQGQKKNGAAESGAGGTTQNGNTGSASTGTGSSKVDNGAGSSEAQDGSDLGSGPEEASLDPLKLLEKGLSKADDGGTADETGAGEEKIQVENKVVTEKPGEKTGGALRAQLEKALATNRELEQRLKSTEGREDPKVKEITTAWQTEKKAREDAEAKVAHLDYSQSREFQERFVKPYESAFSDSLSRIKTTQKTDGTKLSQEQLESIMLGGEEEAYRIIDENFEGPKATMLTGLMKDVYSLDRVRERALSQAKGMAVEQRKQQEAQSKAYQESIKSLYEQERDSRLNKMPDVFMPKDGDKKRNALLQEGGILADAAFFKPPNISDKQWVAITAEVRNRATAFPALHEENIGLKKRLAEVEKKLEKYQNHGPGRGEVSDGTTNRKKSEPGTFEAAREQLAEIAGLR